ncbi:MAG: DUF5947 family protein [Solirubrobacterales bacterium]
MKDQLERVQRLSERIEAIADPDGREAAEEAIDAVLELHGSGLSRIGELLGEMGEAGAEAKRCLLADDEVAGLLLIHGLAPLPPSSTELPMAQGGCVTNGGVAANGGSELNVIAPDHVTGLRERCELCQAELPAEHRHLLHLEERTILCACEPCVAIRAGEGPYRPTGSRLLWLEGFELPDELWAGLRIPIGLAFFMRSSSAGRVVGMYPSPAGATECELQLSAWEDLCAANSVLDDLDEDVEGLIVNLTDGRRQFAIAPIDECYRLVGTVRDGWEGISGGGAVERVVPAFLEKLRSRAEVAA